jgi:chitosanase
MPSTKSRIFSSCAVIVVAVVSFHLAPDRSRADQPPPAVRGAATAGACDFSDEKQFCSCLGLTCGGDTLPDKKGIYHTVYCGACTGSNVCVAKATFAGGAVGVCQNLHGLSAAQKKVAEQLTSLWENSTPTIDYAYAEDIKDGRGYTSGRAGFCTGTGDAIVVLACYDAAKPNNVLHKYRDPLRKIQNAFVKSQGKIPQGSTAGLAGWIKNWGKAAADPVFRGCQDGVVDAVYYGLAIQHAYDKGFTTALTKAAFYDAQINMGEDNADYGMRAMIAKTDAKTGPVGKPPTRQEESKWLGNFLRLRAQIMFDDAKTWRENMYRVANYEQLRLAGNFDLSGCIKTGVVTAAGIWPGAGFTTDPGPAASLGSCP